MSFLAGILTPIIQKLLFWIVQKSWDFVSTEGRDLLSSYHFKKEIRSILDEYEIVIKDAQEKAKDGLTPEEIEEIRRKKIEIEEKLVNTGRE